MAATQQTSQLDDRVILGKATKNAASALGLRLNELAEVIGVDRTTINRGIDPKSKTGDIALTFIRCYRALHALFGGDRENIKYWFATYNKHLNGVPKELVKNIQGLGTVIRYLDGMRGKV